MVTRDGELVQLADRVALLQHLAANAGKVVLHTESDQGLGTEYRDDLQYLRVSVVSRPTQVGRRSPVSGAGSECSRGSDLLDVEPPASIGVEPSRRGRAVGPHRLTAGRRVHARASDDQDRSRRVIERFANM